VKCVICGTEDGAHTQLYGIFWIAVDSNTVMVLTHNDTDKAKCDKWICAFCVKCVETAVITGELQV